MKLQKIIRGPLTSTALFFEARRFALNNRCFILSGSSFNARTIGADIREQDGLLIAHHKVYGILPTSEAYDEIRKAASCFGVPGVIIAIGGGRILDLGKILSCWFQSGRDVLKYPSQTCQISSKKIPLLGVPTTFGSGAESTPFSVLYVDGEKWSIDFVNLLPDVVFLDFELCLSAGSEIKTSSGLDAVCQAIESLLSKRRTIRSISLASRSLKLSVSSLSAAVLGDRKASRRMLLASNLAGKAIAVTRTGIPHALSYLLSSKYNVPHGIAVSTSMGPYLRWVQDRDPVTLLAKDLWPLEKQWRDLVVSVDPGLLNRFNYYLNKYGDEMVRNVNIDRFRNTAASMSQDDLCYLLN